MVMVCEWFGLKITRTVFAGLASKPMVTVSGGLASKPAATVSVSFASKPAATVFYGLPSKSVATVFSSLTSKLVVMVSPGLTSKPAVSFLVEPQNQGSREFLGLGLKTKWASVCRLRHKIDGVRSAWDTHRDLTVCFTWKQV
jgi:hypothetical protein